MTATATKPKTPISKAPPTNLGLSGFLYLRPGKVDMKRGIIKDVAIVMEGEAKGHGFHIDDEFISDTTQEGKRAGTKGIKARFGHPTMSSEALGTFIGRFKNFRQDTVKATNLAEGNEKHIAKAVTRADLFLSNAAKDTPHGDLYNYVLNLAKGDPDAFGNSIVFDRGPTYTRDEDGKKRFTDYYGDTWVDDGEKIPEDEKRFVSMDKLRGSDLVDEGAATDGLFSEFNQATWAGQVTDFLETHPQIFELIHGNPEMIAEFMEKYESFKKRKDGKMAKEKIEETETDVAEVTGDEEEAPETPESEEGGDVETPAEPEAEMDDEPEATEEAPGETEDSEGDDTDAGSEATQAEASVDDEPVKMSEGERFLEAFGHQGGVWFAKGLTFDQAQAVYYEAMANENKELKTRLAAIGKVGEEEAAVFEEAPVVEATGDFFEQATEKKRSEGITFERAASKLAKEKPELYKAYKDSQKKAK